MNTIRRVDNQISVVMLPGRGDVWATAGPLACGGEDQFHLLRLDSLLPNAAEPAAKSQRVPLPAGKPPLARPAVGDGSCGVEPQDDAKGGVSRRFVLRMAEAPLPEPVAAPQPLRGPAWILGDNPLAKSLQEELRGRGATVFALPSDEEPQRVLAAMDHSWRSAPAPHSFLLTPHDAQAVTTIAEAAWNARMTRGVILPYLVCQRWFQLVRDAGLVDQATVVACGALGGDLGLSGRVVSAESGAMAGLMKALANELAREKRSFRAKMIDMTAGQSAREMTDLVCREFFAADPESEVGYSAGRRHIVRAVDEPASVLPRSDVAHGGVWIVTGGARGITAVVARELGRRFGMKLHLLGSSPPPQIEPAWREMSREQLRQLRTRITAEAAGSGELPIEAWRRVEKAIEIDGNLRAFAADGVQVAYHECDVSDRRALAQVLQRIRLAGGTIEGVLHGGIRERFAFRKEEPRQRGKDDLRQGGRRVVARPSSARWTSRVRATRCCWPGKGTKRTRNLRTRSCRSTTDRSSKNIFVRWEFGGIDAHRRIGQFM